jgi:hypothetical protein
MKLNKLISLTATTAVFLAGCFGPQTYFSSVFNTLYDTYYPTKNDDLRLNMNYQVEATIVTETKTITYEVYFFEVGIKLIQTSPEIKDGVQTTRTLSLIYDYQADGMFATRTYASNPTDIEKIFTTFDNNAFSVFDQATNMIDSTITSEVSSIINNQATNLVIGGQPIDQDVKIYNLPVARFMNLSTFDSTTGFTPETLTIKVTFTTSTNEGQFEINATGEGKSYQANLKLSNSSLLNPANYLLTETQKITYQGYNA